MLCFCSASPSGCPLLLGVKTPSPLEPLQAVQASGAFPLMLLLNVCTSYNFPGRILELEANRAFLPKLFLPAVSDCLLEPFSSGFCILPSSSSVHVCTEQFLVSCPPPHTGKNLSQSNNCQAGLQKPSLWPIK